ncbi:FosX/FosE/FosI family fosfomycin resistance hydrolase [Desulfovibrio ferrophilus]|uniref:Fosfomycin resistance family protein n=1 Tax=Desulfovibrio ferrophilus TaxID=241368 RepID=A0A2Z6AUS5_9BACT|nr:FosX/FosE/FosI family fosfomycin resistance hydrolase [Desulfovibrio ferrophilus]BBD06989.1 fosfomycin resistance family protein [Desulfovibrio ferrophilus]
MIEGLSHITFIVRDLERTSRFLTTVFDAEQVYASGEELHSIAPERFFMVGGVWIAIMEGEPLPEPSYNHVAFKVSENLLETYAQRVRGMGLEVHAGRQRIPGEAQSLYFHDYDDHLFELHTGTLDQRLKAYK